MITPVFPCTVEKGILRAGVAYYRWLQTLEGKDLETIVRKKRRQRSLPQNRYFHGVVCRIFCDTLWGDGEYEEMKRALCEKFLSSVDERTGLKRIKSTTELSTVEWELFMRQCRKFGDELGFFVPEPNQIAFDK